MPEDNKKQPKEQRKRRGRQQPASTAVDKKSEKEPEVPKISSSKAQEKPAKPAYESPPPEFYKNLKRETDEILKITEEENSKYKKKEIVSNWSKYEMPVETYDEIDEQENLGADYETLAQAPLSIGGHFQFKHEKSWDSNSGPTLYDKYFDINMQNLNIALSTIPFFERNGIDLSIFSETDIQSMNHRATKFKQKYYKDKKYNTPELEAQERILNSLTKSDDTKDNSHKKETEINLDGNESIVEYVEREKPNNTDVSSNETSITHNEENKCNIESNTENIESIKPLSINEVPNDMAKTEIIKTTEENKVKLNNNNLKTQVERDSNLEVDDILNDKDIKSNKRISCEEVIAKLDDINLAPKSEVPKVPAEPVSKPVIESPEDLEKWLDDFLDG